MDQHEFADQINELNDQLSLFFLRESSNESRETELSYRETSSADKTKLQLSYLLSRTGRQNPNLDLDLSKHILSTIPETSQYKQQLASLSTEVAHLQDEQKIRSLSQWLLSFPKESNLLAQERKTLEQQVQCCPTDEALIKLAHLLTLPKTSPSHVQMDKISKKLELLAIYKGSDQNKKFYAIFAQLLLTRIGLTHQLIQKETQIKALQNQLELLKDIDDLMDENQRSLDSALPK